MVEELQAEDRILEIAELFPRQGEWTEEDYFRLPESNRMIELSKGRLIISPSPTLKHQTISGNLFSLIRNHVRANNLGVVIAAPMDVRLRKGIIRKPDIIFMSNEHRDRLTNECLGIPDLVVEILSKNNIEEDRKRKFKQYQKAGIPEYWIVDTFQQTVEVFTLENGAYVLSGNYGTGEIAQSKLLAGFQVAVDSVFE
ncbi:Uma2 family endonuclease [Candidatus Poribacteria bacterium]|nr:Uma2 family endonuclease [Candidatus Poribacteria bacterium]